MRLRTGYDPARLLDALHANSAMFICVRQSPRLPVMCLVLPLAPPSLVGWIGLAFHCSDSDCHIFPIPARRSNLESPEPQTTSKVDRLLRFCHSTFGSTLYYPILLLGKRSDHGCTRQGSASHKPVILLGLCYLDNYGQGSEVVH